MNRKALKTALAAAALAGLLAVSAEASNIVGYIKVQAPAGLSLMSVPFNSVGGGTIRLADALKIAPEYTIVAFFVPGSGYTFYTKVSETDWEDENGNNANDVPLTPGDGFWVWNFSGSAFDVILHGDVPLSPINRPLQLGLQIFSYGFPTVAAVNDKGPDAPLDGDIIAVFNGSGYDFYTYSENDEGWVDENGLLTTFAFQPGKAYWYWALSQDVAWVQTRNF